jgi:signal transduction histidine kinase
MQLFDGYQQNRRAVWEVVHEVNNPLGIMLNYLTLIRTGNSLEEIHANAEVIGRELRRVRRIFGRLSGSSQPERPQECRAVLREVVADVLAFLRPNLAQGVALEVVMDSDICVPLEPDLVKQVVLNLVLNGIEAMPGGGTLRIGQGCIERGGRSWATLTVHDTGVGVPPEDLPRLFEPFFTTKAGEEARGLGLSLSQDILGKAGGRIEVESRPGDTSFTVLIPVADPSCTPG